MQDQQVKKKRLGWAAAAFLVWLIMNIRVAAGIGSTFERAVDGLVGVALILGFIYLTLDFFQIIGGDS